MGMTRLLVTLYPRSWRREFGAEFAALLDDTRLTPVAVLDVVVAAGRLRVARGRRLALLTVALLWSAGLEYLSVHARLTANILWAPTTPPRALALVATAGPWLALVAAALAARRRGPGGTAVGRPA